MTTPTLAEETQAANELIQGLQETEEEHISKSDIRESSSTEVNLPGGLYEFDGTVSRTAHVRELTGRDEEAIGRESQKASDTDSYGKILLMILSRGVVQIGDEEDTSEALDMVYMADWDALLLGIYTVTFGNTVDWHYKCTECLERVQTAIDLTEDVEVRPLQEKNRNFTVNGKRDEYRVSLPTGETARKAMTTKFKSVADFSTCLIAGGVREINGVPVLALDPIQNMPMMDRKKVQAEIQKRTPSVQLEAVKTTCPACDEEQILTIPIAALFQSQGLGL